MPAKRRRQSTPQAGNSTYAPVTRQLSVPVFAQPVPTEDPLSFRIPHPSDRPAYDEIDVLNKQHKIFPLPFQP